MTIPRTFPLTGSMPYISDGAITKYRVVTSSTPVAAGELKDKPRCKQAATKAAATVNALDVPVGIAAFTVADAQQISVFGLPGSRLIAESGGNFVADDDLTFDANGRVILFAETAGQYTAYVGRACEDNAAGGAGKYKTILFLPFVVGKG